MSADIPIDIKNMIPYLQTLFTEYGLHLLGALLILFLGRLASRILRDVTVKALHRAKVDETLTLFTSHIVYFGSMLFVILAALNQIGIQTASLIAVIGAAGLAIGLALQGSLSNFAAGVLIIIFRPFRVGDLIEGAGILGTAEEIHILTTQMRTPDNKVVVVPNSTMMADKIINYVSKPTRRIDFVFGVAYNSDLKKVKNILKDILEQHDKVLKDPIPVIGLLEMADSSLNIAVRPWIKTPDYWEVYFDIMEKVKNRFDEEGISIPFPQRDVHLFTHPSET
ncbi:MAG: mechanosensitive ion channel [SAR324 cluster bacterium]|nr:mechanosensitive ion channel [SAR324 cluster bacterium]